MHGHLVKTKTHTHKHTDLNFKHDIYTVKQPHVVNIQERSIIINDFNAYVHFMQGELHFPSFLPIHPY